VWVFGAHLFCRELSYELVNVACSHSIGDGIWVVLLQMAEAAPLPTAARPMVEEREADRQTVVRVTHTIV
jgi:hypothetical protein